MKKRIAILFHEYERSRDRRDYTIHTLADFWTEDGHRVVFLYGVKKFVPADVVIVHVDLSVVPEEYLDFAARYPAAFNGRVRDVRKSSFSADLVGAGDPYGGPVIVKSNLNYAGIPERLVAAGRPRSLRGLLRWPRAARAARGPDAALAPPPEFETPTDYRIYDSPGDVPRGCFGREDLVVEKFLPEMQDGLYCLRLFHFLGDRTACVRIASPSPIVKVDNLVRREIVEPHPEVREMRRTLGFDYGKFDYVLHDGRVVLLDINKTPGESRVIRPAVMARLRHLASGISFFLP
jgi:hypothetical protein